MRNRTGNRPAALRSEAFARAGLGALVLVFTLAAVSPWTEAATSGQEAQRKTVEELRRVGVAMYNWLQDQPAPQVAPLDEMQEAATLSIEAYKRISREDLAALLVPRYIAEVPARDGWGNAYEYRLNTENPRGGSRVMLVRSPAADGTFDDEVYEIGAFPRRQEDEDLVWADGYFIRWPSRD